MPFPSVTFSSELPPVVRKEMEQMWSLFEGWARQEHNPDGTHSHITANALTLTTNPALAAPDVLTLAGGDEWDAVIVGTALLPRQKKQVVRVVLATSTPQVAAIADNAETTGIAGELFIAINASGVPIDILHNTGGYWEHQRIATPDEATYTWVKQQQLLFRYDAVSQRWRFGGESIAAFPELPAAEIPVGGIFAMLSKVACPAGWTQVGTAGRVVLIGNTYGTLSGTATHSHGVTGSIAVSASADAEAFPSTSTFAAGTYPNHAHGMDATASSPAFITVDAHILDFEDVPSVGESLVTVVAPFDASHAVNDIGHIHEDQMTNTDGGGPLDLDVSVDVDVDVEVEVFVSVDDIDLGADEQNHMPLSETWILCAKN